MTIAPPTIAPNPSAPIPTANSPAWLQTLQAVINPIPFVEKARAQYGDIFTGQSLGFPPYIILSHPDGIEQVFTADPNLFDSVSGNRIIALLETKGYCC